MKIPRRCFICGSEESDESHEGETFEHGKEIGGKIFCDHCLMDLKKALSETE